MMHVQEIEKAVSSLNREKLAEFSQWFREYEAATWDTEFEEDAASGKLDVMAEEALGDLNAGRCKEL